MITDNDSHSHKALLSHKEIQEINYLICRMQAVIAGSIITAVFLRGCLNYFCFLSTAASSSSVTIYIVFQRLGNESIEIFKYPGKNLLIKTKCNNIYSCFSLSVHREGSQKKSQLLTNLFRVLQLVIQNPELVCLCFILILLFFPCFDFNLSKYGSGESAVFFCEWPTSKFFRLQWSLKSLSQLLHLQSQSGHKEVNEWALLHFSTAFFTEIGIGLDLTLRL